MDFTETPEQRLARLRAAAPPQTPEERLAALRGSPVPRTPPAGVRSPAEIAAANAADVKEANTPTTAQRVLGTIAAPLSEVPGGKALEAVIAGGGDYRKGYDLVDQAIASSPAWARIPAKLVGGAAATLAMPGSMAMQGARYGVTSALADANPDTGIRDRLWNSNLQGLLGLAGGKASELAGTAVSALRAPTPGALQTTLRGTANEASGPGYRAFRALGDLGRSPALDDLLGMPNPMAGTRGAHGGAVPDVIGGLPIVRRAVEAVKGESPVLAGLPDTDARVLDAVYKRVGNKAFTATHGFEPGEARKTLLSAIEEAAQAKGGTYAEPVGAFSKWMGNLGAAKRGRAVTQNVASSGGGGANAPLQNSPEAFGEWLKTATEDQKANAARGILGQVARGNILDRVHVLGSRLYSPMPSKALRAAPGLLKMAGWQPSASELFLRGLLTNAATPTP